MYRIADYCRSAIVVAPDLLDARCVVLSANHAKAGTHIEDPEHFGVIHVTTLLDHRKNRLWWEQIFNHEAGFGCDPFQIQQSVAGNMN